LLCGANLDEFNAGRGSRNRKTIFSKAFDVELNSFLDEFEDFVASFRDRHTTRQIRNMRPEAGFTLFDYDCVFHKVILFQTGLFENAVERPRRHIDVWFASHGYSSSLRLVFELAMAASRPRQIPTIVLEQFD
jgi:hypothetical protein